KQLKDLAQEQISGNIWILFGIALIIAIIVSIASKIGVECTKNAQHFGSFIASLLISPPFTVSTVLIYLNLAKGIKPNVGMAFEGFKYYLKSVGLYLILFIAEVIGLCLLIVPGIIISLAFSMSFYILAENKNIGIFDALGASRDMMKGHKMDLFVLYLSFIGWELLGILTLGILYIWLVPYMSATYVNFYNAIKPQGENVVIEKA
ncbi:MAG: DUF975 family protein, partial [Bacillota bacterium]|nr:DUF975 family protein [Bacillota bacterium]